MINLVIAGAVRCDAVFAVNWRSFPPVDRALFWRIRGCNILSCDIERAARGQIRIGKNWRGLLGDDDLREKQQKR